MKKLIVFVFCLSMVVGLAFGVSTVSSHSTPGLVDEINTALANPVHTTVEVNGDVILANDETLDNATDAKVRVTFDDDAAVLGELILESDNGGANVADNDTISIIGKANDDQTNKTEYASIDFVAADVSDSTEDGQVLVKGFVAGTERTLATFGAATTVGAAQSTLALTSSDWAISATGVQTGMGAITSDGAISGTGFSASSGGLTIISGAYTGVLNIVSTTLTMVVNGSVTNVLDADITTP